MNVLKINTEPSFEIVPRRKLDVTKTYTVIFDETQTISATVTLLPNENYKLLLASFPTGEKISYKILDGTEIISLGMAIIVSENENIQDYEKSSNQKFYY